jgi:IS5 family transposase
VAHKTSALAIGDLERVVVDTTVQPKAIAHPTDARLRHRGLEKLVDLAQRHHVPLRQSYRPSPSAPLSSSGATPMRTSSHRPGGSSSSAHSARPCDPRHPPPDRRQRDPRGTLCRLVRPDGAGAFPASPAARPQVYALHAPKVECMARAYPCEGGGKAPGALRVRLQGVGGDPGHQTQRRSVCAACQGPAHQSPRRPHFGPVVAEPEALTGSRPAASTSIKAIAAAITRRSSASGSAAKCAASSRRSDAKCGATPRSSRSSAT